MNKILTINTSLFGYKFYQKEINNIGLGDKIFLKIVEKENGYKNIFAYNENEKIGELFNDESNQLLPFVSNSDKFKVEAIIKKFLKKENEMTSAVLEIYVYSDEDIDADDYIDNFYGYSGTEEEQEDEIDERKYIEEKKNELFGVERNIENRLKKKTNENISDGNQTSGCVVIIIGLIVLLCLFKCL